MNNKKTAIVIKRTVHRLERNEFDVQETEESIVPLRHMYAGRIIDEDMGAEHEVEAGALEERKARPVTMAAGCNPGRMLGHARRKFDEALKSCRLNGATRL